MSTAVKVRHRGAADLGRYWSPTSATGSARYQRVKAAATAMRAEGLPLVASDVARRAGVPETATRVILRWALGRQEDWYTEADKAEARAAGHRPSTRRLRAKIRPSVARSPSAGAPGAGTCSRRSGRTSAGGHPRRSIVTTRCPRGGWYPPGGGRRGSVMQRALVVNCSAPHYNLGALKLRDWLTDSGWDVIYWQSGDPGLFAYGYDVVALSVIFSWHAPLARSIALRVKDACEVWAGGPGLFALAAWWRRETGLVAHKGLDARFDRQRGHYKMTFASRGCPVNCSFCIVPRLEGLSMTLDWDFQPAPILCDNNLSALPTEFQDHILRRYQESGTRLMDANSGFEPRTFDASTYERWRGALRGPWRFAFDEMGEEQWVRPMMRILRDVPPSRKRVYVLIGNEPMAACYERLCKVVAWGGEPYCQPVLQLNYLGGPIKVHHDWTEQGLHDFARYAIRNYWKYTSLGEYLPTRRVDRPPFADLAFAKYKPTREAI